MMLISESDLDDLKKAKNLLENPGVAMKISNLIGSPIENAVDKLPVKWKTKIGEVTKNALVKAYDSALYTIKDSSIKESSNIGHKIAVGISGGIGGFFGLAGLAIELPVSTTIMMRSIVDVARSQGESINDDSTKIACIEVFSLGGPSRGDDAAESGYFAVRTSLAAAVSEAVQKGGQSAMVKLIAKVAERFSVQISEKVAADLVPIVGAAGGAAINVAFMDHFQDMALGHFIVRRLENKYGKDAVQKTYIGLL